MTKLLVTGFGPFPGAPENPTEALVHSLAAMPSSAFGAAGFEAAVLPTDFRRAWSKLRALNERFAPDVILHFGLSGRARRLRVERRARRRIDPARPDAAGRVVKCGYALRPGADALPVTVATDALLAALNEAGHSAEPSDDAGDYVCNFILYRSLHAALGTGRAVGFVHVPPHRDNSVTPERLREAAIVALRAALAERRRG